MSITSSAPEARAAQAVARASEASGGAGAEAALDPVGESYPFDLAGMSPEEVLDGLREMGISLPCESPVVMLNRVTGETLRVRCQSRRVAQCRSCAALYSGDARRLLSSGVFADPGAVIVMLTLSAPSFGRVHRADPASVSPRLSESAQAAWRKRSQRCSCPCGERHSADDAVVGAAIDPDLYGYGAQASWNAATGRLWNRTSLMIRRRLGVADPLQYAGVQEFQRRGAAHFHLLLRIPAGVGLGLRRDAAGRLRSRIIEQAVRDASATVDGGVQQWGTQVVAEVIASPGMEGGRHAARTVGYIRKALAYAAKDLGAEAYASGGVAREHTVRAQSAASRMACPRCEEAARLTAETGEAHRCRSPRHRNLGYSGWPLRRSRGWTDLSFGGLRQARGEYVAKRHGDEWGAEKSCSAWVYVGSSSWESVGRVHDLAVQAVVDALARGGTD